MSRQHEHRFDRPWRGRRHCRTCRQTQYHVGTGETAEWRDSMTLQRFAEKWLPAVSGTKPTDMLHVRVAFPFEWNCYESWKVVFKVKFDFGPITDRAHAGLGTLTDVMNGWQSGYQEDFCRVDYEAEKYYEERTGHPYRVGDNTYAEMRQIIQS